MKPSLLSKKAVRSGLLLFFFLFMIFHCPMGGPKGIHMDIDYITEGSPIPLTSSRIYPSQVASCVWYVGDKEVLRSQKLISYTPSPEDQEHMIRVRITLKNKAVYEDSLYFSILPVLYLESDTAYQNVTQEEDAPVSLKLAADSEYPPTQQYTGFGQIHLRGHSTRTFPKRPFKLKLEEKASLLGLGESKHWVLLANAIDPTLIRNQLVYDLSGALGASCQMHSKQVTLIYNGEYQGVYQLCQQVRIEKSSINVYNWEDTAKEASELLASHLAAQNQIFRNEQPAFQYIMELDLKADLSWLETHTFTFSSLASINERDGRNLPTTYNLEDFLDFDRLPKATGGVLLEMDCFSQEEATLKTNYLLPFYFNKPIGGASYEALSSSIQETLQALEYAFHDTDFTYHNASRHYRTKRIGVFDWETFTRTGVTYAPADFDSARLDGAHYSELIDFDSLLNNFLLCEFTVNWDGMKNSVYLYKDIEGPFYLSPAWDYDWAFGNGCCDTNTWNPEIWQTTDEYFSNEEYYQTVQWNRYLIRDPYFLTCLYEAYWEARKGPFEELIRDEGTIDQYAKTLKPAADANDNRWNGCLGNFEGQRFDEGIATLKEFIRLRLTWLDEQFTSIDTLCQSLGYYVPSDTLLIEPAETDFQRGITRITVHTSCPDYTYISFQVNGTHFYTAKVTNETAVLLLPNQDLQNAHGSLSTIQVRALNEQGTYIINPEGTIPGDYSNAISNYITFKP